MADSNEVGEIFFFGQTTGLANQNRINFVADSFGATFGSFDENTAVARAEIDNRVFGSDLGQIKHLVNSLGGGRKIDGTGSYNQAIEKMAKN